MSSFLQKDNTIDVLSEETSIFFDEFFGPLTEEQKEKVLISKHKNIGPILVELGLAESNGWCRKNGWWKELEPGFHEFSFGKNKVKIFVLIALKENL